MSPDSQENSTLRSVLRAPVTGLRALAGLAGLLSLRERRWRPPAGNEPAEELANYRALRDALAQARPPHTAPLLTIDDLRAQPDPARLAGSRQFVADYEPFIDGVREAARRRCRQPRQDGPAETESELGALMGTTVARSVYTQQSLVAWADSDWPGAVEPLFNALQLGVATATGDTRQMMAWAMAVVSAADLARLAPHLDAPTAAAAARRLETVVDTEFSLAATLRRSLTEDAATLAGLFWFGKYGGFPQCLLLPSPAERYRRAVAWLSAVADQADAPRDQWRIPGAEALDWLGDHLDLSVRRIERLLLDVATLRVALADVAVNAYRAAHGYLPPSLEALVPEFLTRVPADAYTAAPLRYRRDGEDFVCWSIGPDLVDDGGVPMVWPDGWLPNDPPLPLAECRGDVVSIAARERAPAQE
mgnify:CR=1 FL=1